MIEVKGRTRYADKATTVITISSYNEKIAVIEGGLIESTGRGGFTISARHATATDEEHDSVHLIILEGAGLQYDYMNPDGFTARGSIFHARYYGDEIPEPTGECDRVSCGEKHGFMEYQPPKNPWLPGQYDIEVRFI